MLRITRRTILLSLIVTPPSDAERDNFSIDERVKHQRNQ